MVYLDNAATTQPFPEVVTLMQELSQEVFGNPSSTHASGRKARAIIEQSRKDIAKLIGASSNEIIFTSGGTESNNIFLQGIASQVNKIICSPLEHPAVLNAVKRLEENGHDVTWLGVNEQGELANTEIAELLSANPGALLVAMHGNNEIGNLNDLEKLSEITASHKGYYFTDAVQTVGHYEIDMAAISLVGLSASAHKFHGPKGVGFLYVKYGTKLQRLFFGGEQERGLRAGTENVASIAGMAKALQICSQDLPGCQKKAYALKDELRSSLKKVFPDIQFNGIQANNKSMHNILSVSFPPHEENEMLQFNLDMAGIAVSSGSACASGAVKDSHVMAALNHDKKRAVIRFSLSRFSTYEDINLAIEKLREIYEKN